eukprot:g6213.t1
MCRLWGCDGRRLFDGHLHDFCCRGHAQLAKARGEWPRPANKGSSMCSLPGCKELVYRDSETGEESQYCSRKHAGEAKRRECLRTGCSRTAFLANTAGPQFCSRACADAECVGPTTLDPYVGWITCNLPGCLENSLRFVTWRSLHFCCEAHRVLHFTSRWQSEKPVGGPEVVDIIKINIDGQIRDRHEDYKTMVPNVRRRFHGTSSSRACRFYVGGSMCLHPDCGLCNIATQGFKIEGKVGRSLVRNNRPQWLMYGRGIYFTSVSGKANFFSQYTAKRAADGAWVRCMLVADVAAGNALVTTQKNFPPAWTPPPFIHSVVGEAGPDKKADELVCYDPAAALPTHFVVYRP